jgi:hypothetical protein
VKIISVENMLSIEKRFFRYNGKITLKKKRLLRTWKKLKKQRMKRISKRSFTCENQQKKLPKPFFSSGECFIKSTYRKISENQG